MLATSQFYKGSFDIIKPQLCTFLSSSAQGQVQESNPGLMWEKQTLAIVHFFHFTVEAVAISFDSSICSHLNGLKLPDWTNVSEAGTDQLIRRTHFVLAFALNESGALFVMFAWGEILL